MGKSVLEVILNKEQLDHPRRSGYLETMRAILPDSLVSDRTERNQFRNKALRLALSYYTTLEKVNAVSSDASGQIELIKEAIDRARQRQTGGSR